MRFSFLKFGWCMVLLGLSFSAQAQVVKDKTVRFKAQSQQATDFIWTFPSGETFSGKEATFVFTDSGVQPVTLTVKNRNTGEENSITKDVFVRNLGKPTALLKIKTSDGFIIQSGKDVTRGDELTFLSESVDNEGSKENLSETWLLNGRTIDQNRLANEISELGTYRVKLVAAQSNNANLRDTDGIVFRVVNAAPIVEGVRIQEDPRLGLAKVQLEVQANDVDGDIKSYRFEALENGVVREAQISSFNQVFFNLQQYPGQHRYHFRVFVTDNDRKKTEYNAPEYLEVDVEIPNEAPKAEVFVTPSILGDTSTTFTFYGEATDADKDALTYEWIFPNRVRRFGKQVSYRFSEPGSHTVKLKVSDAIEVVEKHLKLTIKEAEKQTISNRPPLAEIRTVLPSTVVHVNTGVSFYSGAQDPDKDPLTYEWNMGDNTRFSLQNVNYVYTRPGNYRVTLNVSDGKASAMKSVVIKVLESEASLPSSDGDPSVLTEDRGKSSAPLEKEAIHISTNKSTLERNIENEISAVSEEMNEVNSAQDVANLRAELAYLKRELENLQNPGKEVSVAFFKQAVQAEQDRLEAENDAAIKAAIEAHIKELKGYAFSLNTVEVVDGVLPHELYMEQKKQQAESANYEDRLLMVDQLARLQQTQARVDANAFNFINALGTTRSSFFLYAVAPTEFPKALRFEWDLGDGRTLQGQNIRVQYPEPGEYKVGLTVSDGTNRVSDFVTVRVRAAITGN